MPHTKSQNVLPAYCKPFSNSKVKTKQKQCAPPPPPSLNSVKSFSGRDRARFMTRIADGYFLHIGQCVYSILVPRPELDLNNLFVVMTNRKIVYFTSILGQFLILSAAANIAFCLYHIEVKLISYKPVMNVVHIFFNLFLVFFYKFIRCRNIYVVSSLGVGFSGLISGKSLM